MLHVIISSVHRIFFGIPVLFLFDFLFLLIVFLLAQSSLKSLSSDKFLGAQFHGLIRDESLNMSKDEETLFATLAMIDSDDESQPTVHMRRIALWTEKRLLLNTKKAVESDVKMSSLHGYGLFARHECHPGLDVIYI